MGVKLQFVLGVILVSLVCGSKDSSSEGPTSSTTADNVALDKPERHINLIEKPPKTETELKNVNTNTQKNLTNDKSNKTEPIVGTPTRVADDNEKTESLSNNVVEKDRVDNNKENAIKTDLTDKNREDKSKPTDPEKITSAEYHRKNNLYTSPLSTDSEKYFDQIFNPKSSTEKFDNFDNFELTTPKSYFFDTRYRSSVHSIAQKLQDVDDDMDSEEEDSHQVERLTLRDTTPSPNFMEFKELQGTKNKTFKDKNSVHKDTLVMQVKRVNINTSFQDTVYDDDDEDKEDTFPRGESDKLDTTTAKNNFILTTRKTVAFTKPPVTKNNSYILNNKIETETLKAKNFVTTELPTTRTRGDDLRSSHSSDEIDRISTTEKIQDNQIIPLQAATATTGKISTTTIEHNLIPATEDDEETTTNSEESFRSTTTIFEDSRTIRIEENFTPTIRISQDLKESTSREELDSSEEDTSSEEPTTNMVEPTIDHTTEVLPETSTGFERKSEPLIEEILSINDEPTTIRDRSSTIYNHESTVDEQRDENTAVDTERTLLTTTNDGKSLTTTEDEKPIERNSETSTITKVTEETTESKIRAEISTTREDETTAMPKDEINTSEIEVGTTETGIRTSKSMNLANGSESENPIGSSSSRTDENSFPAVTEIITKTTTEDGPATTYKSSNTSDDTPSTTSEVTEGITSGFGEVEAVATTQRAITTVPTIVETTGEMFSTFNARDAKTFPESTETVTIPPTVPTRTDMEDSTTLKPKSPTEEATEEVRENYPTSTTTTTSTKVYIVRKANIYENQTTILPQTMPPGVDYPSTTTEVPTEVSRFTEDAIIITTTEDFADTAATEGVTGNPDDNKGTIAAIVISTVGAVCLILLAGLLYIMRKRQKRFNYGERCRPVSLDDYSVDNVSVYNSVRRKGNFRQSKRSYGNPAFDDPAIVSHPLNFPALAKFGNNIDDIKAEFEEIPQISARTSELPEGCETKNRYANVIPLPETRVFLNPIEGYPNSDYINANYVTGPKNVKGYYIATQAPMQNTVDDFWRMIWEQQSKVILMITHFFENGMEKCVDYLPPSEVLDCNRLFGDFQVTLKKRDVKDKYIISSLQLKNMVSNSWREVTHFWYMGWPEKGVPSEGNSLIAFLIEARSYMKSSTLDKNSTLNGGINNAINEINPVVVHCSPGTGRTGVVIACDIAIREFEQTRLVDIPKIVYRLRRDRANAVQTKEQYMFIYKVVSLYATKLTGGSLDSL